MSDAINQLLKLSEQLPRGLKSDWIGSDHFELTCASDDHFWLDLADLFDRPEVGGWCRTEFGQRVGLLMDIAAKLKEAEPALRELIG